MNTVVSMKNLTSNSIKLIFVCLCLLCLMSVNSWSLWVDEAITVKMYSVNSFSELIDQFYLLPGSEVQMPGWVFYMWFWCKLFGSSEYAIRSANFVFISLFLLYSYSLATNKRYAEKYKVFIIIVVIISICNPFILYNMNEARCNIPIFALAFITILSLYSFLELNRKQDWYICLVSFVLAYAFNMLAGFLLISLLVIIWQQKGWKIIVKQRKSILIGSLFFMSFTIYYLITIFITQKGGAIERPGIGNLGYSFYEFAGFGGLGPSKNMIRNSENIKELLFQFILYVLPLVLCYIALFIFAFKQKNRKKLFNGYFLSLVSGIAIFFIIALIIQFRFWGRHLIYFYPLWILFIGNILYHFYQKNNVLGKLVVGFFGVSIIFSSFNILFNEKYKKENIKGIIQKAKFLQQPKEIIYWSEAEASSSYYNLSGVLVKNDLPTSTDSGLLIWLKRMEWIKKEEYKLFLKEHPFEVLYEDYDFVIYRFSSPN